MLPQAPISRDRMTSVDLGDYDAAIIGGGLAGCSLAIQLATRGYRIILFEKQTYPAHKLCGEFLSVEVQAMFQQLHVLDAVMEAGAHPITKTRVTSPSGQAFEAHLPGTALGLSRFRLDQLLAEKAASQGVLVRDGSLVSEVGGSYAHGFSIHTKKEHCQAKLVLGAWGKRGVLDRKLARPFMQKASPVAAFKAHFRGVAIPNYIELHAFAGGYCGLSHVEDGVVNACWITTVDALKASGGSPTGMMEGVMASNPELKARFEKMHNVMGGFKAVGQVTFAQKGLFDGNVMMVGDTTGMIAPLCGDGMAMALTGADLAAPLVSKYLDDMLSAEAMKRAYQRAWTRTFRWRLRLGSLLHGLYIQPTLSNAGVRLCNHLPSLARWLIRNTRG